MNQDVINFAKLLNNRKHGNEITREEEETAKKLNLVIVFGASNNLINLRGSIKSEIDIYTGDVSFKEDVFYLRNNTLFSLKNPFSEIDQQIEFLNDLGLLKELNLKKIKFICGEHTYCYWSYKTDIPHETFDILEDGKLYCKGIVFSLNDV